MNMKKILKKEILNIKNKISEKEMEELKWI